MVLSEVNNVCNIHCMVQHCSSDEYVLLLNNFSHLNGRIVGLREAGWTNRRIAAMLGTMYQWCVAAFSSGLWNIPTPVHQVLDGRVVQTHVKIDSLCKQSWPPEQHPGKKSEYMSRLLCHQGPLVTVCLQQDSDHACLWPGYHLHHDIAKHCYSGVLKASTGG